jgi:hypothetical protein
MMARKIGEIDWRRDSEFWKDVMREKEVKGGKILTFVGGGTESRQGVRRKVHEHLGTWEKIQSGQRTDSATAPIAA